MTSHHKVGPGNAQLLRAIYQRLVEVYGPQGWWPGNTTIEIIVGAYLTQNTSWRGVERSILNLKQRRVLTVAGLRRLSTEELMALIRPSGYMVRKAAALKHFLALLDREYRGSLARMRCEQTVILRSKLLALPGVGPETADAILLYAFGHPVMVVDEYLRRVVTRHELVNAKAKYAEIQQVALSAFSSDTPPSLRQHFNEFHALVVQIGKEFCGPRPRCERCPLGVQQFHPPHIR